MVVVDIIVLFRGSKYRNNKQLGQTNNQKKKTTNWKQQVTLSINKPTPQL
jgi:hypothetical protein